MRAIRSRDTGPELAVRRLVHRAGLRYRVHARPLPTLPRRADLIFSRRRVAVFIDGCFWHACPEHGHEVQTNAAYWNPKIRANRARDIDTDSRLRAAGWLVLRYWAHQPTEEIAEAILRAVGSTSAAAPRRPPD